MKKILTMFMLLTMLLVCLTGCGNYALFDNKWQFNRALIELPGGEVLEVQVNSWTDSDGEQLTITATDGTVYLVSANNCTMIKE